MACVHSELQQQGVVCEREHRIQALVPRQEPKAQSMTTGGVSVCRIALPEAGLFLGAVRDRVVFDCGVLTFVRWTALDPAGTFEAFFLAVLL